jgi:hypothetical protein
MLRVLGENEKVDHGVMAAGQHRRTDDERKDQYLSWVRSDQAFFAAGACHILAYVTQAAYPAEQISLFGVRPVGSDSVNHVVAGWGEYAFDFSGWHRLGELLAANEAFEGRRLEFVEIKESLEDFCATHSHRLPKQFYADPSKRARKNMLLFKPPFLARV